MYLPRKSRSLICLPLPSCSVNGPPTNEAVPPRLSTTKAPAPRLTTATTNPTMPKMNGAGRPPRDGGSVDVLMTGPDPRPVPPCKVALPPARDECQLCAIRVTFAHDMPSMASHEAHGGATRINRFNQHCIVVPAVRDATLLQQSADSRIAVRR